MKVRWPVNQPFMNTALLIVFLANPFYCLRFREIGDARAVVFSSVVGIWLDWPAVNSPPHNSPFANNSFLEKDHVFSLLSCISFVCTC